MPKKKIEVEMTSYGIYTQWERDSKQLPKIRKHTKEIPSELDIEFGYILRILRAKGSKITFVMKHPPFCDDEGRVRPDFVGEEMVNSNEWHFFLGDTVWAPIEDKCGEWELITMLDGREVARMKFNLFNPNVL
ncbi:MAG: DUF3859 domain-containing protein [Rikenellaceae bacterium]